MTAILTCLDPALFDVDLFRREWAVSDGQLQDYHVTSYIGEFVNTLTSLFYSTTLPNPSTNAISPF
jgi:hypothetical protein